ncbi:MAG: diaminopimelate epimerase [Candidatus Nanopelagicales bacterium]
MIHDLPGAVPFLKGHGTGNDFVLLPDLEGRLDLTPERVRAVCDRRFGLGADGVLRVVPAIDDPDGAPWADEARFFMDYRNADGSVAEMCGNGARVFARYLVTAGLAPAGELRFVTRGGVRHAHVDPVGDVVVGMGSAVADAGGAEIRVRVGERDWAATGVLVPNPHAVAFVDDLRHAGPLDTPPEVTPGAAFPDGVNVEFVVDRGPAHVAMRVFERGVGETLSCGTGACAVAYAARRRDGASADRTWRVDVPGGTVHVTEHEDGSLDLAGPAVLVAEGEILAEWWESAG